MYEFERGREEALRTELSGYEARIEGAKEVGDKDEQTRAENRAKQVKAQLDALGKRSAKEESGTPRRTGSRSRQTTEK